jgi:formylglycine-generating enzyme required for sulfatase activity
MDPVSIIQAALIRGLIEIGRNIVRVGLEKVTEVSLDEVAEWFDGVKDKLSLGSGEALDNAICTSLEDCGVSAKDPEEIRSWMKQTGLNRLGENNSSLLSRQLMLGLLAFKDPNTAPPEHVREALDWPRSREAELGVFLASLRGSLSKLDGWKEFLEFADKAAEDDKWPQVSQELARFENYLVQAPNGRDIRVSTMNSGLSLAEIIQIEDSYRRGLLNEYFKHTVSGLAQIRKIVRLPLMDIYIELGLVPLKPMPDRLSKNGPEPIETSYEVSRQLERTYGGISTVLAENRQLVLVGKPGGGKTTTLKYVALMLAKGGHGASRLGFDTPYIPLLVRLADYARARRDQPSLALETFLLDYIEQYYPGPPRQGDFLQIALEQGGCMILLDGLDEVADFGDNLMEVNNLRVQVLKEVERFAARRCTGEKANRIVVTSRIEGYRVGGLPGFTEMEITDLRDEKEIETFLDRWFTAYEKEANPDLTYGMASHWTRFNYVERLMPVIMNWESMRRLATNPLLLTILAVIHIMGRRLPNRRVELYETVTRTLIENWRPAQTDHVSNMHETINANDVYYLMASLAYWLHENQAGGTMPEADWQRKIEELLNKEGFPVDTTDIVERFLRYAREEAGLLTERSVGQIGFFHITLEEYLAAVEIARQAANDRSKILESRWHNPRWKEVILLAAGVLDMQGNSPAVKTYIADLLWMDDSSDPTLAGRSVILAGRTLVDLHHRKKNTATFRSVMRALRLTMQDLDPDTERPSPQPTVTLATRVEAGDVLDELGWRPPNLHTLVHIRHRYEWRSDDVRPMEPVDYSFCIGRFPVTNLQYQRFVESPEFNNPDYWVNFPKFDELCQPIEGKWRDVGMRWLMMQLDQNQEKGLHVSVYPSHWNDAHFGIQRASAPVVGVSWFEANAYCRWLAEHWDDLDESKQNPGMRPKEIRLPTEAEWIVAAGGDRKNNRFPWNAKGKVSRGVDNIVRAANVRESDIGRTTNVATYPLGRSTHGAWDMAGNCWEWLANYFSSAHMYLAMRGGSWVASREFAQMSGRIYDIGPNYRSNDRGFRVMVIPEA